MFGTVVVTMRVGMTVCHSGSVEELLLCQRLVMFYVVFGVVLSVMLYRYVCFKKCNCFRGMF